MFKMKTRLHFTVTNWASEQAGIVEDTAVAGPDDVSQKTMAEVENMVASTGLVNPVRYEPAPSSLVLVPLGGYCT